MSDEKVSKQKFARHLDAVISDGEAGRAFKTMLMTLRYGSEEEKKDWHEGRARDWEEICEKMPDVNPVYEPPKEVVYYIGPDADATPQLIEPPIIEELSDNDVLPEPRERERSATR